MYWFRVHPQPWPAFLHTKAGESQKLKQLRLGPGLLSNPSWKGQFQQMPSPNVSGKITFSWDQGRGAGWGTALWHLWTLGTPKYAWQKSLKEQFLPQVCLEAFFRSDLMGEMSDLFLVDWAGSPTSSPAPWQNRTHGNTYPREWLWGVNGGVLIKTTFWCSY